MREMKTTIFFGLLALGFLYFVYIKYNEAPPPITIIDKPLPEELSGFTEGNKDASFKVYNFFDYSCPYCKESERILSKLQNEFTRKFQIIHVPIPLADDNSATYQAAANSVCYYGQENDLKMHKYLMENQDSLQVVSDRNIDQIPFLKTKYLKEIKECMDEGNFENTLSTNKLIAREIGISSVPVTIVVGEIYVGLQREQDYRNIISKHLRN